MRRERGVDDELHMDQAIVAGEPCLVTRSPLIPRSVLCDCTLRPLLSRLKSSEDFVAFVAEPCIVAPDTLEAILVTGSWPRCVFEKDSKDARKATLRTIRPDVMLVERELYLKLTTKSCIFGDFIDSLLLYNRDREKILRLLGNVRTSIKDKDSYGLFFMTEVRGMEDFMDQMAGIFDIVVNAGVETKPEGSQISLSLAKHPDISQVGKRIEVDLDEGSGKRV